MKAKFLILFVFVIAVSLNSLETSGNLNEKYESLVAEYQRLVTSVQPDSNEISRITGEINKIKEEIQKQTSGLSDSLKKENIKNKLSEIFSSVKIKKPGLTIQNKKLNDPQYLLTESNNPEELINGGVTLILEGNEEKGREVLKKAIETCENKQEFQNEAELLKTLIEEDAKTDQLKADIENFTGKYKSSFKWINPFYHVNKFSLKRKAKTAMKEQNKLYSKSVEASRGRFMHLLKHPGKDQENQYRVSETVVSLSLRTRGNLSKVRIDGEKPVMDNDPETLDFDETPVNRHMIPSTLDSVDGVDKLTLNNVVWGYKINEDDSGESFYQNSQIDISKVKDVFYLSEKFPPEWIAAHGMLLVTFKDEKGHISNGKSSAGLILSVEAWRNEGVAYSLTEGLKKKFKLIYLMLSMEGLIESRVTGRSHTVEAYRVLIDEVQKKELLREIIFSAILDHTQDWYHTLNASCVTGSAREINKVLEHDKQLDFWYINNVLHNINISMPVFIPKYFIKKKIAVESKKITPENYADFLTIGYSIPDASEEGNELNTQELNAVKIIEEKQ